MLQLIIVLASLTSIVYCNTQKATYPIYYAEDVCEEDIKVIKIGSHPSNSSLILKSNKINTYFKSCYLRIESSNDHQIHANINPMIESYKSNAIKLTKLRNNKILIIKFSGMRRDFQVIVTSFKAIDDTEKCPKSYFLCEKNKCILDIFRCDSYINCDNDESQFTCAEDTTPGNTALITIILTILLSLFGTTFLLSSVLYFKYYKHRKGLLNSKQILYGTVNASISTQNSFNLYKGSKK